MLETRPTVLYVWPAHQHQGCEGKQAQVQREHLAALEPEVALLPSYLHAW